MSRPKNRRTAPTRNSRTSADSRGAALGVPFASRGGVLGALRRTRVAVEEVDQELEELLDVVQDPQKRPDARAPERLRAKASAAAEALDDLSAHQSALW